jgi:hypothetical protein
MSVAEFMDTSKLVPMQISNPVSYPPTDSSFNETGIIMKAYECWGSFGRRVNPSYKVSYNLVGDKRFVLQRQSDVISKFELAECEWSPLTNEKSKVSARIVQMEV